MSSLFFPEKKYQRARGLYNKLTVFLFAGMFFGCHPFLTNEVKASRVDMKQEKPDKTKNDASKDSQKNKETHKTESVNHPDVSKSFTIPSSGIGDMTGDATDFPPVLGGKK